MAEPDPPQVARKSGSRWVKGQSGNPRGKQRGHRNKVLVALDGIGAENAPTILAKAVEAALAGDMRAIELILSRAWPARKGRPVELLIPEVRTAADLPGAMTAITAAVSAGDLTPDEGAAVASILELHRRTIETADLERRLAALEAAQNEP